MEERTMSKYPQGKAHWSPPLSGTGCAVAPMAPPVWPLFGPPFGLRALAAQGSTIRMAVAGQGASSWGANGHPRTWQARATKV